MSRWTRCPHCGGVAEDLEVFIGCTNTDAACRWWRKESREAWARAGYPDPGEQGRDETGWRVDFGDGDAIVTAYAPPPPI